MVTEEPKVAGLGHRLVEAKLRELLAEARSRGHQLGHRRLDGEDARGPAGPQRLVVRRRRVRGRAAMRVGLDGRSLHVPAPPPRLSQQRIGDGLTTKKTTTELRRCTGSARFGIEPHEAPVSGFPKQPSPQGWPRRDVHRALAGLREGPARGAEGCADDRRTGGRRRVAGASRRPRTGPGRTSGALTLGLAKPMPPRS